MTIDRFVEAHEKPNSYSPSISNYSKALGEIQNGKKTTDWIWYIFPQMEGLGHSYNASYYGIKDLAEAEAYLNHSILGTRLIEISSALFSLNETNLEIIVGSTDKRKICSCMTLFSQINASHPIFLQVLDKYFSGKMDNQTLQKLKPAL